MWNFVKIAINEENCKPLVNWRKATSKVNYDITTSAQGKSVQKNKQRNKVVTLTVSRGKGICLMRSKQKKIKGT